MKKTKIITAAVAVIVIISWLMTVSSLAAAAGWFLLLLGGFSISGWVCLAVWTKIGKKQITNPFFTGVTVTGMIGVIAVACILNLQKNAETALGALIISPFIIVASVVAGCIVGKIISCRGKKGVGH